MNNQNIEKNSIIKKDEVNLIDLAKTIWDGRKTIMKSIIIFMAIGLFVAIFSEPEYTAYTTMVPQTEESASALGGNLGGLAAMAGINLNSLGEDVGVSPNLYPKIVRSIPFQKELMKTQLSIKGFEKKMSFADYYLNVYRPGILGYLKRFTIGLPSTIRKSLGKDENFTSETANHELLSVSQKEKELIKRLSDQLILEVNDKDGDVSISAIMPEAKAAAELTKNALHLLQNEITNHKILKSQDQLSFVENQYKLKKEEYIVVQKELAQFSDQNRNVSTAAARIKLQQLEAEYNLIYGVYSELAKQLETQKIQVKKNTPVFTVIEPVTIPYEKSAPNRMLLIVLFSFIGVIAGFIYVFSKDFISTIRKQFQKSH
ncbi:MAG: Wzz/FepE/Etk N-terminal domain-containing protein [Clostridia bacterium]|nr:Wzz/FepE/Etk N-terminal domain-containing protein [Clostridia bacterium]